MKEVYLPSLRRQRVDVLVYILWGLILPDLMQDHLRTVAKFRLRTMNKAERTRLARVNELNGKHIFTSLSNRYYYLKFLLQTIEEEAAARIVSQEGNRIKVLSFTDDNITYDVLINADDDFIVSCTCRGNQTNNSPYKHMYLVCIDTARGRPILHQHQYTRSQTFHVQDQNQLAFQLSSYSSLGRVLPHAFLSFPLEFLMAWMVLP